MEINVINLPKGGKLIRSMIGNIQFGIPPETIKDSSKIEGGVPEYFIIPSKRFDWKDGINFMEFEFPVYYNFFIRKKRKTKLICDFKTMKDIQVIFQETLLGPRDFSRFHRVTRSRTFCYALDACTSCASGERAVDSRRTPPATSACCSVSAELPVAVPAS